MQQTFPSLHYFLRNAAHHIKTPESTFLLEKVENEYHKITYVEIFEQLNAISAFLYSKGYKKGDKARAVVLGIDKKNVRFVIHWDMPQSLEGYYQEIGRAGRDGLKSDCVLFYTYADTRKHEFFINQISDKKLHDTAQEKLDEVLSYCELNTCRKKYLLKYFGEDLKTNNCQACDCCNTVHETFNSSEIAKKIMSAILANFHSMLGYLTLKFSRKSDSSRHLG
jgi:hypothetical protein